MQARARSAPDDKPAGQMAAKGEGMNGRGGAEECAHLGESEAASYEGGPVVEDEAVAEERRRGEPEAIVGSGAPYQIAEQVLPGPDAPA